MQGTSILSSSGVLCHCKPLKQSRKHKCRGEDSSANSSTAWKHERSATQKIVKSSDFSRNQIYKKGKANNHLSLFTSQKQEDNGLQWVLEIDSTKAYSQCKVKWV